MEKIKLYNWYGESFDPVVPEVHQTLKAYKHQVKNVYTRLVDNTKSREQIEKDLYLRAKTKIEDNLKRELSSLRVAYKNKLRVFEDSIKALKYAESMNTFIKFELSKLKKEKKALKAYVKDYIKSLYSTSDEEERKKELIENLFIKTKENEKELLSKYACLNILLKKLNGREYSFNDFELSYYNAHKESGYFDEMHFKLEEKRKEFLRKKDNLQSKLNKTRELQKNLYLNEKHNLKLETKKKIKEIEYEYNQKILEARDKAKAYKKAAYLKIKEHKSQILESSHKNEQRLNKLKQNAKSFKKLAKTQYKKDLKHLYSNLDKSIQKDTETLSSLFKSSDESQVKIYNQILTKEANSPLNKSLIKKELKAAALSKYKKALSNEYKKFSYEGLYNESVSKAQSEYFSDTHKTRTKFLKEKVDSKFNLEVLKINNSIETEKETYKAKKAEVLQKYNDLMQSAKDKYKANDISKEALKNLRIEAKIFKKESLYTLKLENSISKNKESLKTLFWRRREELNVNKKILESKINEAQKSIPTECIKNLRWWSLLLGVLLPGLPELIWFKQYTKSALMLIATTFIYAIILPFSFGAYWSKMGGIPGFYDLGSSLHDISQGILTDARYYLFGGVVSVILVVFAVIYFTVSGLGAYRVAKHLEGGSRPSMWSHTKRWLKTAGFPWSISLMGWSLMIFVVITPIITSVLISFTNYGYKHIAPSQTVDWIGLKSWGYWWTFRENNLLLSLSRVITWTLIWTVLSTIIPISVGFLMAILANNNRLKGRGIFRIIFILPWAIPAFVTIMFIKSTLVGGDQGYLNLILIKLGILEHGIDWLNSITKARVILVIVQTWIGYAWIFMLVTGNLQSIPKDIYEAGSVDGAKRFQLFRYLTLPALVLAIAPMLIGQFVGAFNNFTIISLLTGGGPNYPTPTVFGEASTDIIISWVFKIAQGAIQIEGNQSFGAALATFAALISISFAARGFIKSMSRRG
ncbi:carbohydrate ABC transporter permease [Mycoplasma sp. Ms02]|uniref:carbohydrate ABC transporter permease n=1 Tax=Mycoplasma sp. Ms02 TaxID=353851 RepID=UPI001C8926A0|nr:ABC transporter permease subunit [Mycoplasma sp. Ms02]QZE12126.1 ABC transporter permease subunit [Mycoplasma sp. Ms02]